MKTMKNFLSMAALVLMGLAMTSCINNELVNEQPVNTDKKVTLTTTVGLDGGETKALTSTGVKTFAAGDKIAVIYTKNGGTVAKAESAVLQDNGDITNEGKKATFTVTLDDPDRTQNVTYIYPAAMAKDDGTVNYDDLYTKQDGTLATLGSTFDYCTNSGAWDEGKLPTLTLENQLAILDITLKDIDGSNNITSSITGLTVSVGTNTYTVNGLSSPNPIYVAIRPTSDVKIWILATTGTTNYTKSLTRTYSASNGYSVSWRMATVGDVILSNGTFAKKGTSGAVALITYVGNDAETSTSNTEYKHGLALALVTAHEDTQCPWCNHSDATCMGAQYDDEAAAKADMAGIANTDYLIGHAPDGHTHNAANAARGYNGSIHPSGTSEWFLPSAGQWDKMITAAGGFETMMTNASLNGYYWSSTEKDSQKVWDCIFTLDKKKWHSGKKTNSSDWKVRACLAF